MTPHRDPNAHKGSVPNELTAFPGRGERARQGGREGGGGALTMGDLCSATQGKRYQVPSTHMAAYSGTHTLPQPGEEVACEVNPIP